MEKDEQYSRYKPDNKLNIITESLSKEIYEKERGDLNDDPYAPKEITFEVAKEYWERYKRAGERFSDISINSTENTEEFDKETMLKLYKEQQAAKNRTDNNSEKKCED